MWLFRVVCLLAAACVTWRTAQAYPRPVRLFSRLALPSSTTGSDVEARLYLLYDRVTRKLHWDMLRVDDEIHSIRILLSGGEDVRAFDYREGVRGAAVVVVTDQCGPCACSGNAIVQLSDEILRDAKEGRWQAEWSVSGAAHTVPLHRIVEEPTPTHLVFLPHKYGRVLEIESDPNIPHDPTAFRKGQQGSSQNGSVAECASDGAAMSQHPMLRIDSGGDVVLLSHRSGHPLFWTVFPHPYWDAEKGRAVTLWDCSSVDIATVGGACDAIVNITRRNAISQTDLTAARERHFRDGLLRFSADGAHCGGAGPQSEGACPLVPPMTKPKRSKEDAQEVMLVSLSGVEHLPPVATRAYGVALLLLDKATRCLRWWVVHDVDVAGSPQASPPNAATRIVFHGPAERNEEGDVMFTLDSAASPSTGSRTVSAAEYDDILDGAVYINVCSRWRPGGELRGQVELFGTRELTANEQVLRQLRLV
mmetsp:Transcript_28034/g.70386  ORF Transcript_28034/g.70386 Transcript_28034/m.70386 type:complete len:477 (+) Transcript_28034:40-1470(+)